MKVLFVEYPKCTTCQKAKKWLVDNKIDFEDRHIVEKNPSATELKKWWKMSGLELRKFFNTSGLKYKELALKDNLKAMNDEDKIKLLASDGMLVKRPIFVNDNVILVGFKEEEWKEKLK